MAPACLCFQRFQFAEPVLADGGMKDEEVFELLQKVTNREVSVEAVRRFLTVEEVENAVPKRPEGVRYLSEYSAKKEGMQKSKRGLHGSG
ncbi:hypothetical protein PsYK624_102310 [Phanerochaete sordida]|uniref:Uncharacterized protein n=1 Tax=Phanerochaete sordida TaxID=48140 RepID=A0A9P3LGQ6_9APHY|nr:hypothetical protein PsYK624_102310 [Phanerochaete sordida]